MQPDQTVTIGWPDKETGDRVLALIERDPVLKLTFEGALDHATKTTVPRIMAGAYGAEPVKIMLTCERFVSEGARAGFGEDIDGDEAFVWREGYLAVCRRAANEFGQQVETIGAAGAALMQFAGGINAAVEALTALERLQAAAAPASRPAPAPHALALGCRTPAPVRSPSRRPLRPEDFGALSR